MKEINCPNCNQRIKIIGTIGYDLYRENLLKKEQEIERLKEEYMILQNASDEVEEELQQRIDKAIEYIEEQSKFIEGCDIYRICNKDVLLDILKGVDKE